MKAASHVELVRAQKAADALACGIDESRISVLVDRFYSAVRTDDLLGPIFQRHVKDWPHHLARMKDFWMSVIVEPGRFSGNPMQKHIAIGELGGGHFNRWQSLWDQTLMDSAPSAEAANRFRQAARRIGESLLTGIEIKRDGLKSISVRTA